MRFIFVVSLTFVFMTSCSKDESTSVPEAVPSATYTVEGPTCQSSGEEPQYPNAGAAADLYDFSNATYKLTISGGTATQVFTDEDCAITIERQISANAESFFSFREKRTTTSDPEGCEITIINDDTSFPFTASNPSIATIEGETVELLFNVEAGEGDGQFLLKSRDEEPDTLTWQNYGCANPDQIIYSLSRD